ncbi:MAG: phytoene/squalene synthase family protein [Polyangiaceae bacterium]
MEGTTKRDASPKGGRRVSPSPADGSPTATRRHAHAVYAFCRRCDDSVDADGERGGTIDARRAAVDDRRRELDRVYGPTLPDDDLLAAFATTVHDRAIPRHAFDELLDGMAIDLTLRDVATWSELDRYCQLAAGTVGVMMASVFGVTMPSALTEAAALGRAMQLTNILRDVGEDLRDHDRVYLPREALESAGVTREDLARFVAARALDRSQAAEGLRHVMRQAAARADRLYAQADLGVPLLATPTARTCVRLMRATYASILDAIEEADHDVFAARRSTSTTRKLRVSARALLLAPIHPLGAPAPVRRGAT